jgi:hypothetical protein
MFKQVISVILGVSMLSSVVCAEPVNQHYPVNKEPLLQTHFVSLPVGAVKPKGWLEDQLKIQANGLTGHLDEFWPSIKNSAWKSETGESWERGPYYLDGLVPLAYQLEDERLIEKVKGWIEPMLASGQPSGWFGPKQNSDRWPLAVAMKVLIQYHDATGDERVIPLLKNYFKYLNENPPDWPDRQWRGVRAMENIVTAYWLYRRTGDESILDAAETIYNHCFDWANHFINFPYDDAALKRGFRYGHPCHVVNLGMAIKYPGLVYPLTKEDRLKIGSFKGIENLDKYHGQVAGRYSGDEHLSGRHPSQGTELCGVVEFMFSLENLIEIFGDPKLSDRLELLAYNANPGTCTPDYWAHQYDQQANQVICTDAKRQWSTNGNRSNLYGLEPNYGCCTSNMHQGWPKLITHMWMATHDQGLAAVVYGPNQVNAKVADGENVTITQQTSYPFDDIIQMTVNVDKPTQFPLYLRIPGWAEGAWIAGKDKLHRPDAGSYFCMNKTWKNGDTVQIYLPLNIRTETRFNNSVSILRGPIYYSLKIGEHFKELKRYHDTFPVIDWAIYPTTAWNYALKLDRRFPEDTISVEQRPVSSIPFSNEEPPVVLRLKGRKIPEWTIVNNSAGAPPVSPVQSEQLLEEIQLIPYGCTRLRITEFPVLID